ncbi:unnamed protein product [Brassicogethes aeneus]|uniref:Soluble interferon alpha/beta receptor OPG204 n=1 Tax=Brassicogethes aeneus TaxID=1431903 RepID=A0A9P0FJJ1_BRAAE|nr:unnamed protein product [Brassicogethes aeneus]
MANKHAIVFALSAFLILNSAIAIQDFCSQDNFNTSGTHLQLTREASSEEFGVIGQFKSLHCCAKGYRSIEWYKDGKLLPWPQASFIIYPELANQTIYTQQLTEDDAGNYTCVIRNDTVYLTHTIMFVVFDKVPEDPKFTYISEDKKIAVGHDLRLFCEAFAGRVDLPDALNEAVWTKVNYNGTAATMDKDPRIKQKKSQREAEQTYGTYLIIENIKNADFGEYICTVTKPGFELKRSVIVRELEEVIYLNPNPIPVKKLLIFLSILAIIGTVIGILYLRYALMLRVELKDKLGPVENSNGKTSDVMIVYSGKDTEIALGVLLPTLENQYNYKCSSRELPLNVNMWYSHLKEPAKSTKRLLPLLSPALLNEKWESDNVLMALKQLQLVGPQMCCVALKELPKKENEVKNAQGETLTSLSRNLNVITWDRQNEEKFWLSLRLRLPPNRMRLEVNSSASNGGNNSRLTGISRQESLDNLV